MNKEIQAKLASIPPFPKVATEVVQELRNPNGSMARVAKLVERDPAITVNVLKMANSGLYARRGPVTCVTAALNALGADMFEHSILRAATKSFAGAAMPAADLKKCWEHCLATADISRHLASKVGISGELAQTAGLLHDIGRFGLAAAEPVKHHGLIAGHPQIDVMETELELFGIDHTTAGRIVCEQFQLPEHILLVAGRHHDHLDVTETDLLAVVSVACSVASAVGFSVVPRSAPPTIEAIVAQAPLALRPFVSADPAFWQVLLKDTFIAA